MAPTFQLDPVDAVDVTIVVDNAIDILAAGNEVARRPARVWEWSKQPQLRAEHGYGLHISVEKDGRRSSILYDAGLTRDTFSHNLDVLDLKLGDVQSLVMSHGHADHHGGLEGLAARLGRRLPMVLHPAIWTDRRVVFPTGESMHLPPPSHNDLDREGWQIVEEINPSLLLEGKLLVTGQVERVTPFEKGMPTHEARAADGSWQPDHWIWDDQAVVVNVRDKGLVVMSSCSHSGAINVLRHARKVTGIDKVHAFIGGCHLTGGIFEEIIPDTVAEFANLAPDYLVPGHCTGWRATSLIASTMPDRYIQSSVGTVLRFGAEGGSS